MMIMMRMMIMMLMIQEQAREKISSILTLIAWFERDFRKQSVVRINAMIALGTKEW